MRGISNSVVAITGGGSGLGLGLAHYMLKQQAKLAILENMPAKVAALRTQFGDEVLTFRGDVRSTADVVAFHDAIVQKFGGVDSLVGTQGVFDGNRRLKDIPADQLDAAFDEIMQVNVRGYITTAKVFFESLARRNGSIVFAASPASYCADGGG